MNEVPAEAATVPPDPNQAPRPPGGVGGPPGFPEVPGYEILGELGRGGRGVVYQARCRRLSRPVALKMVLAGGASRPEERARFRAEAEAVAAISHAGRPHLRDRRTGRAAVLHDGVLPRR